MHARSRSVTPAQAGAQSRRAAAVDSRLRGNDELDTLQPLVDDLLEWVATPRAYAEVMDAWRTSCPRLPVWEEANRLGLVQCGRDAAGVERVALTEDGRRRLQARRAVAST